MNDTTLPERLFRALADGALHSGADLALAQDVTRSAVWKAIGQLREIGAAITAVPNRGYQLDAACTPLDVAALRAALPAELAPLVERVECAWTLPSTNSALLARDAPSAGHFRVLLTEHQSAGRGRLGRRWLGTLGGSIFLSLDTCLAELPRDIAGLPLMIGVCVRRALSAHGVQGVLLKWPNDLVARRNAGSASAGLDKLGGILMEMRAEAGGPAHIVIGIGLNVELPGALQESVAEAGTSATDLRRLGLAHHDRNRIAADVSAECIRGLQRLCRDGLDAIREEWQGADALAGQAVRVQGAGAEWFGVARGLDAAGALRVEVDGRIQTVLAGDVSVRGVP